MEVTATARYVSVSPRKIRLTLEHLPGQRVRDALAMLRHFPTPNARIAGKVVKSAAANAENNYALDPDSLYVKAAYAGDARRLKRFRAAPRGRVHRYVRRTSHITVIVEDREG